MVGYSKLITYWIQRRVMSSMCTSARLHGATFQKDIIFTLGAVKTFNLTYETVDCFIFLGLEVNINTDQICLNFKK
jgi:hypothetical protein